MKIKYFGFLVTMIFCPLLLNSCGEQESVNNNVNKKFLVEFTNDFKNEYFINERISYEGLVVKDEQTKEEIPYYNIYPTEGSRLTTLGDITVTISLPKYDDYSFTINVKNDGSYVETTNLELYSVNDFHGSFNENRDNGEIGMSKLATFLKDKVNQEAVVLSAGDMWQGGVESNLTKGQIIIDSMNYVGFDSMTVGNHEFDWGFDTLENNIKSMEFPMLAANAIDKRTNEAFPYFEPYTIVEKKGVKIGIVGTGAESLPTDITYSVSKYLEFTDQVETVKEYSDFLKTEENCDIVVLAAHDGGSDSYGEEPIYFTELTTVSDISGEKYVDAIFLGHDHDTKSGELNDVPYAEGGSNGKGLSYINLKLEKNGDDFDVVDSVSTTIDPYSSGYFNKEDSYINSLLEKYSDELAQADRVICSFSEAKSKNDFLELVCDAMIAYANDPKHESILIDDQKVTAAFHNTGGVRDSAESGDFTYRDLIKVLPFDNTYCIAKLTDQQFDAWNNSSNYYKGSKGSGKYTYVATINYLADNPDYSPSEKVFNTNIVIQDIFIEYLEANDGSF